MQTYLCAESFRKWRPRDSRASSLRSLMATSPPSPTAMRRQISLFCSRIRDRRFDDATLGLLQAVLVAKDVKSSVEIRSSLSRFMRSESPSILREIADKSVDRMLLVLDFLVRATALMSDFESCLALRYEALVLRDAKSACHQWLQVGCVEWLDFAEHAIDNGFHSIARKACDNALLTLGKSEDEVVPILDKEEVTKRIERLKSIALLSVSSCSGSVQAEAAEYLKRKTDKKSQQPASFSNEYRPCASDLYRESIKKRHAREFFLMRLTGNSLPHKNMRH